MTKKEFNTNNLIRIYSIKQSDVDKQIIFLFPHLDYAGSVINSECKESIVCSQEKEDANIVSGICNCGHLILEKLPKVNDMLYRGKAKAYKVV